jgi:hypothetical protein
MLSLSLQIVAILVHIIEFVLYFVLIVPKYKYWCRPKCHFAKYKPLHIVISSASAVFTMLIVILIGLKYGCLHNLIYWRASIIIIALNIIFVLIPRFIEHQLLKEAKEFAEEHVLV